MIEHPILFSGQMVAAIFEGRKTQTRRVIKPAMWPLVEEVFRVNGHWEFEVLDGTIDSPYGYAGDRLWVRESWLPLNDTPTPKLMAGDTIYYRADYVGEALEGKWRPSIHMPRWASRLTLEIVNVRAERVQDITEEDAIAEGAPLGRVLGWGRAGMFSHREGFMNLWDGINDKRGYGWLSNPWVWVIEFRRVI